MAEFICVLMCYECMCHTQTHTLPSQDQMRTVAKDPMIERGRERESEMDADISIIIYITFAKWAWNWK